MKTAGHPSTILLLAILLALAPAAGIRAADASRSASIALSQPAQPATLVVELPLAHLRFVETDSDAIQVIDQTAAEASAPLPVVLSEQANRVQLTLAGTFSAENPPVLDLLIQLPRTTNLLLTSGGGRLLLTGLRGDVEINQTANGSIQLIDLSGSIVVNAGAAEIRASLTANPTKVIALTTGEGPIELTLPADTAASVTLRSHLGRIDTNFAAAKLKTKTVKARADAASPAPGKLVTGTLNGGGVAVTLATVGGAITLRQGPPAQPDPDETWRGVTVRFQDPDNFTDAVEDSPGSTSAYYLDELREYVQRIAASRLAAGQRLTIVFLDLDLAGYIRPDRHNLRVLTGGSPPRAHLRFQLIGSDGQPLREGEQQLSDPSYQFNAPLPGRDEPLYYEKQMLRDWILQEFAAPAKR